MLIATRFVIGQAVKRVPSIVEAAGEAVLIRTLLSKEPCQYYLC